MLWLHLRFCVFCSRYAGQIAMMNHIFRLGQHLPGDEATLTDRSKARMRQTISDQEESEPSGT